ncbi:RB1-inducible coiled-coil protein 1 isoform X1 [Prorops nasuta]|uniref:RB1-inducible coiled-coil protein 1 isoform X1 n=1 Tax=Prorops nasuta TaxID=863751 RepID=UPI0034CDBD09
MLYVFNVDKGTTITFDIKLALQSVAELKEAIERECGMQAEHQVLLMSGGETLEPNSRVCIYSAGTDTNPIYLFSKASIESPNPPEPGVDYGSDVDLQYQIDNSLSMPASYATVSLRAQLAQQCCAMAREQTRICEKLVHDQHLQQQGWAAVIANLEDITQTFEARSQYLQDGIRYYLRERQHYLDLLGHFQIDLANLSKIPILPALLPYAEGVMSEKESRSEVPAETSNEQLNLLRWISTRDNRGSLEQMAEFCNRALEQFDEETVNALVGEVNFTLETAKMADMKEVKGLGERLSALELLMVQMKKLVQEQGELAQGFVQNQIRANNLGDASVLPDLCDSHRRQLQVMLENHNHLRDIRRRCAKAKEELSANIYHRLKWITHVENRMVEMDSKLFMYYEGLRRLKRHLEILHQVHLAPQIYLTAVAEVVRRRIFSEAFLSWARNLACRLMLIHSEELSRRREFDEKFQNHFLTTMFPGLNDVPPPFAIEAPSVFDTDLPQLTVKDIQLLKEELPELASALSIPDLDGITRFFLSNNLSGVGNEDKYSKEANSMTMEVPLKEQETTMLTDREYVAKVETQQRDIVAIVAIVEGDSTESKIVYNSAKESRRKDMEVGGSQSVSSASSASTNVSSLNSKMTDLTSHSSIASSEPGSYHFPSQTSGGERPSHLSPLTECAESGGESGVRSVANSHPSNDAFQAPNPSSPSHPFSNAPQGATCDGQQQRASSGGSSPSMGFGPTDFMCTEFYLDESLPSSLSEHQADGQQHQAIVSLLQENLSSAREEVERLQSILKTMKTVVYEALISLREELAVLKDRSNEDRSGLSEIIERVGQALSLYSNECDRCLQEKEHELSVDHQREMKDMKTLLLNRENEMNAMKRSLDEKDVKLSEYELTITSLGYRLDNTVSEMEELEQQMRDVHKQNQKLSEEVRGLSSKLISSKNKIDFLEDNVAEYQRNHNKLVMEAADKMAMEATARLQQEYKTELETLRRKFKLMTASTLEKSPGDFPFEQTVERSSNVADASKQETFLAKLMWEMNEEKTEAVRRAVEEERQKWSEKMEAEMSRVMRLVGDKEVQVEECIVRETTLLEECERYKKSIKEFMEHSEDLTRPDMEKSTIHEESEDEALYFSQSEASLAIGIGEEVTSDVEASESKKVRLEIKADPIDMARKLEILENDNKRLMEEVQSLRESKDASDARVKSLKAADIHLKTKLKMITHLLNTNAKSTVDRDMCASVAVIPDSSSEEPSTSVMRSSSSSSTSSSGIHRGTTVTNSCDLGDTVLVTWNGAYRNFTINLKSDFLHFLNSECLAAFKIKVKDDGTPSQLQFVGEVTEKQFCHAKKSENRYNVPLGTKFYRIRVKPLGHWRGPHLWNVPGRIGNKRIDE